jgi:hypothetical protein
MFAEILEPKIDRLIDTDVLEELMLRTDLGYFAERILNMEVVGHHREWSNLVAKHDRIAINAPRDHGKSFFFCFAYAIWRAYYRWIPDVPAEFKSIPRQPLGYIFSNTQEQAIAHLELIKQELESNPKLQHLVPTVKTVWSKKEIKLANGAIIRARGWGVGVRGAHPGWIVGDDVLGEENLYSEVIRKKERDYMFSAVTNMIVPRGQVVVVGTPFHSEDLYAELQRNKAYFFKRYAALNEKGEALWPTRYNADSLLARKEEIGSLRFTREFLCIPIADENSLFPERILQGCCDPQYEMPTFLHPEEKRDLRVFTGVDLALSATIGADFTVITTLGVDENGQRWILDIRRKKGQTMTEQLREIEHVNQTYSPQKILIEDNTFQRVFRDELVRRTDMPVEGFTTTARNKNSLETGVPSLQILFENKKFVVPRKTERCREITNVLLHELKCFTWVDGKLQGLGSHDDTVMSLWLANEAVRSSSFSFSFA